MKWAPLIIILLSFSTQAAMRSGSALPSNAVLQEWVRQSSLESGRSSKEQLGALPKAFVEGKAKSWMQSSDENTRFLGVRMAGIMKLESLKPQIQAIASEFPDQSVGIEANLVLRSLLNSVERQALLQKYQRDWKSYHDLMRLTALDSIHAWGLLPDPRFLRQTLDDSFPEVRISATRILLNALRAKINFQPEVIEKAKSLKPAQARELVWEYFLKAETDELRRLGQKGESMHCEGESNKKIQELCVQVKSRLSRKPASNCPPFCLQDEVDESTQLALEAQASQGTQLKQEKFNDSAARDGERRRYSPERYQKNIYASVERAIQEIQNLRWKSPTVCLNCLNPWVIQEGMAPEDVQFVRDGQARLSPRELRELAQCQAHYEKIFDRPVINMNVTFGFFDTDDSMITDYYGRLALVQKLTEPCDDRKSRQACGFERNPDDIYSLAKMVKGPSGAFHQVNLRIVHSSVASSKSGVFASREEQAKQSQLARDNFLQNMSSKLNLVVSHSRKGCGPDFEPPIYLKENGRMTSRVDFDAYQKECRGYKDMVSSLAASPEKPAVIGVLSCVSDKHFGRALQKHAPKSAHILTRADRDGNEEVQYFETSVGQVYAVLDATLTQQCQRGFANELRVASRYFDDQSLPTPVLKNFFREDL